MGQRAQAIRQRFYAEVILGAASVLLVLLTLIWKDWIEIVFGVDPDGGNGAVEYLVCLAFLAAAAGSWWLARTEWRRFRALATAAK
jgi:hypothetical protein